MANARTHIIQPGEALLIVVQHNGARYLRDSNFFDDYGDADFVAHWLDDDVAEIRRIDTTTWASEDITEDLATYWLRSRDEECGVEVDDEPAMPSYVRHSRAWALWRDDIEAERPVDVWHQYSTLNHQQQGIGR